MAQQPQHLPNNPEAVFAERQSQPHLLREIRDQLATMNREGVVMKVPPPQVPPQSNEARKLQEIADALRPVPLGI